MFVYGKHSFPELGCASAGGHLERQLFATWVYEEQGATTRLKHLGPGGNDLVEQLIKLTEGIEGAYYVVQPR